MEIEAISTARTVLRAFHLGDIDDISAVLGHPEVMQFSLSGTYS